MSDTYYGKTYAECMAEAPAFIALKIDYTQPIQLDDFVSLFTSLESAFDRFVRERFPDIKPQTQVFVKGIRPGSVEADLLASIGAVVVYLEHTLVIEDFVRRWGERLSRYFNPGGRLENTSRAELKDFMDAVRAIAKDPNGHNRIESVRFEDGKRQVRAPPSACSIRRSN